MSPAPTAGRCNASGTPDPNGAYLRVDVTAAVQSLIVGTEKNTLTIRIRTRLRGTGPWTNRNVIVHPSLTYNAWVVVSGGAIFDTTSSWEVQVEVADKLYTAIDQVSVGTADVLIDLNGRTGVGVKKAHEQGALDVGGDIYQSGQLVVDVARTATTARAGILPLATQAEVDAGTDAGKAVTAKTAREAAWAAFSAASGKVTAAQNTSGLTAVTFPAGRFTVPPHITFGVGNYVAGAVPAYRNVTKDGFDLLTHHVTTGLNAPGVAVDWTATQMTPTAAAG